MLGKLIKFEFKATARLFLGLFGVMLALAVLQLASRVLMENVFTNAFGSVLFGTMTFLFVLAMIGGLLITTVVVVQRFYKNVLGNQGYLMNTLPVSANQHILSKLIVASVWEVLSMILIYLCVCIALIGKDFFGWMHDAFATLRLMGLNPAFIVGGFLGAVSLSIIGGTLMWYAACGVGPHITRHRLGGTIIAYVIGYVAFQIVTVGVMAVLFGANMDVFNSDTFGIMDPDFGKFWNLTCLSIAIPSIFLGVASWIVTHFTISKKLNLA
jgi:hypothetical protein